LEYVKGRVFYRLWPFQSVQQSEDKWKCTVASIKYSNMNKL
jgi:hypothetical protein